MYTTIDQEIFTLKIICVQIFRVVKISRFRPICEIFLTVADYNMDKRLKISYCLVYYQVSGEPRIAGCTSIWHLPRGGWTCTRKLIHWSSPCKFNFRVLKFRGWSRPRNYLNSKIFPIYGRLEISCMLQHPYLKFHTWILARGYAPIYATNYPVNFFMRSYAQFKVRANCYN